MTSNEIVKEEAIPLLLFDPLKKGKILIFYNLTLTHFN